MKNAILTLTNVKTNETTQITCRRWWTCNGNITYESLDLNLIELNNDSYSLYSVEYVERY